jgi:hypothetical protein
LPRCARNDRLVLVNNRLVLINDRLVLVTDRLVLVTDRSVLVTVIFIQDGTARGRCATNEKIPSPGCI